MANDIPLISRRAGAPITSAGGSGGAALGTLGTSTSRTPDMTGVGGALGSLVGALVAARPSGSTPNQNRTPTPTPRPVEERPIDVLDSEGNKVGTTNQNAPFEPPGGYPSRDTPTMGASEATQSIQFPPGTTQAEISVYAPGYVVSGVNMSNGNVIATPDLMIGGGTLFGDRKARVNFEDSITPTGTYERDSLGNIYDPDGNLYAIKNAGEGYTVKVGADEWINSFTNNTYSTDELFGRSSTGSSGYDPTALFGGGSGASLLGGSAISPDFSIGPNFTPTPGVSDMFTGGGYDPMQDMISSPVAESFPYDFSNELSSDQITDMLGGNRESPVISMDGFDVDDLFSSGFFDDLLPSFDFDTSGSFFDDFGSSLSDFGSDIFDFFTPSSFSFGDLFSKDGGHVNKYANGGNVRGYVDGGNVLTGGAIGGGLGALIGRLLSGRTTGRVNTGVDMSQVGVIPPKTTDFGVGPARYVPFREYSPRTAAPQFNMPSAQPNYAEIMRNLGVPGFADGGSASYYTYGTPVDAKAVLRGSGMPVPAMKSGGLPKATAPMTMDGRHDYRHGQYVDGIGDGQSDEIPAMLADGEYVIDSDTVAALGNGSNKAGAKLLDGMRKEIRAHKRSAPVDKIPPKAKSPLEYMRMGAMKKGRK